MKSNHPETHSLPVLLYHRIINNQSLIGKHKIYVKENVFEKQLSYLKTKGFETITFIDLQKNPSLDLRNKIMLTFDDGYEDNYQLLFPLLKKYNYTAVIYLVTKEKNNAWGRKEGEPELKMMTDEMVKEMSNYGIEMGGHTRHHVDLSRCNESQCRDEIAGCRQDVEKIINKEVISFAYPFGGINESVKKITQEAGYTYAVSTNTGPKQFGKDRFQIRRIEITPKTNMISFKNKVSGNYFQPSFIQSLFSNKQTT